MQNEIGHQQFYPEVNRRRLEKILEIESELAYHVIEESIKINLNEVFISHKSHWYVNSALQIIPFDTDDEFHHELVRRIVFQLFNIYNDSKRLGTETTNYFHTRRGVQQYLASFLLRQLKPRATKLFSEVLDKVFQEVGQMTFNEGKEFVGEILEQIILEEDSFKSPRFWDLWEVLAAKIQESSQRHFLSYLFLSIRWWNDGADDWPPIRSKISFVKETILNLGQYDLQSVLQLLAGIGSKPLLPEGLLWLKIALDANPQPLQELRERDTFFYSERLIQKVFYQHMKAIKESSELRDSFLSLLNLMVDAGSSVSFIVRERVISV
jgi:hypothetical protein